MQHPFFTLAVVALIGAWAGLTVSLECRPPGPNFPRPTLATSAILEAATQDLGKLIDDAVNLKIKAGWDVPNVSFSIGIISQDQPSPEVPVWEYHHRASNTFLGAKVIDRHSQYLIGSISKAITVAVLLRSGIDIDQPITKYIPELGSSPSLISWHLITLRSLASHLSGIPPNYGFSEYYYLKDVFEYLGLPHITSQDFARCDVSGLNEGCTKDQYIQVLKEMSPIAPPNDRPIYSNIAFTLLMYAVGAQTNQTYAELLQEYLTKPFKMAGTYPSPGNYDQAVIPPVTNNWGSLYLDGAPGGGLVSTLADLSTFIHSILTHTILDTKTAVYEWLQPRSFTGSPNSLFGMPWEIFRPPPATVFSKNGAATGKPHTLSIVMKDGVAFGYHSRIAMLDEYGLGFVILTAGDPRAREIIGNAILNVIVPSVDQAAKEQTKELGYVGSFINKCGDVSFNATLGMDEESLILVALNRNNANILDSLVYIFAVTSAVLIPGNHPDSQLRLYPTQVSTESVFQGRSITKEEWRMAWNATLDRASDLPGQDISDYDCRAWETIDWTYYGNESMDKFVFVKDTKTGEVLGFDVPFLRSNGTSDGTCWQDIQYLQRT